MKTKVVLPRNYVVVLSDDNRRHCVHPFGYIMGMTSLAKFETIEKWISEWAHFNGETPEAVLYELRGGIEAKNGNDELLTNSSRDIVNGVRRYSSKIIGKVNSKSEGNGVHDVNLSFEGASLSEFAKMETSCGCAERRFSDVKDKKSLCMHLATLAMALHADTTRGDSLSKDQSITGLKAHSRKTPFLPFDFRGLESVAIQALMDYYVYEKDFFEINRELTENEGIYNPQILEELRDPKSGKVTFSVIRQREQAFKPKSKEDEKYFSEANKLIGTMGSRFGSFGFQFQGYELAFRGSDQECVGRRYRKGNRVLTVCHSPELPPIVIDRTLTRNKHSSLSHTEEEMPHPLLRGPNHHEIDDYTRRVSNTAYLTPDEIVYQDKNLGFKIPNDLQARYGRIMIEENSN